MKKLIALFVGAVISCLAIAMAETKPVEIPENGASIMLPVARKLTDKDGRTVEVSILSKSDTVVKVARSDGKEFGIQIDTLSDDDRKFVENIKIPTPIPFEKGNSQWRLHYGYYVLIRVKDEIFAIKAVGIPSSKPSITKNDPCFYAIKYEVVKFAKGPAGRTIVSKTVDAEGQPNRCSIDCNDFKLVWSAGGNKTGWIGFSKSVLGRNTKVGVPPGTECYNQQLPTLDLIASLDPKGWFPLPNQ